MNTAPPDRNPARLPDPELDQRPDAEPDDELEEDVPPPPPWSRGKQDVAAVLWASFLTAAVGTMLFFAFVDPAEMLDAITPDPEGSRMTGYGFGFFFFWLLALAAGGLALFLVRTARRANENSNGNGQRNGRDADSGGDHGNHGPGGP